MKPDPRPVMVAGLRTPIGTAGGALASATVEDLGGAVLSALVRRSANCAPDGVILGNCMGPGGNVARVAALAGGLPTSTWSMTVDQQCSSGLGAVALAASSVMANDESVIAGGVESASTAPIRSWRAPDGTAGAPYDRAPFAPRGSDDPDMGLAADLLAQERGIPRERQDAYAARSHERAITSMESGVFTAEVIGVTGVLNDERPRTGFSPERLARFPAAFREGGTVTAANSCGVNDAAAAIMLVPGGTHGENDGPGLRLLSWASAGVEPSTPGLGLVPAASKALERAGLAWADIDVIEFNEAFAAQILACCDEFGIDDERVCRQGGAIALGHPWGASGAVLMVRLFTQIALQEKGRFGLAAIAGGGGQGTAVVVERCP